MTQTPSMVPPQRSVGWFEDTIQVRGCKLSLENIAEMYRELDAINKSYGVSEIAKLDRNTNMTDDEWTAHKAFLLDDAFRLTVSIKGQHDQLRYDEVDTIFSDPNLPIPIETIYFNNITAWQRHSPNSIPLNRLEVKLDFSKPELFDPTIGVSEATPNNSQVFVHAKDITFFRAVQRTVESKLLSRKIWYSAIHRSFSYDFGMWFVLLPLSLFTITYYMDQLIPIDSDLASYRWAFFIYALGLSLLFYRSLMSYTKWAFPVNVLDENKDRAWRHRLFLGGIVGAVLAKIGDTLYTLVVS